MKRILFVLSRDYEKQDHTGRTRIIHNYREILSSYAYEEIILSNAIQEYSAFNFFVFIGKRVIKSIFTNDRLFLQKDIYWIDSNKKLLKRTFQKNYDIVFVDGVRSFSLIKEYVANSSKVILDMDDLMSLRYKFYADNNFPLILGGIGNKLIFLRILLPKILVKKYYLFESRNFISEEVNANKNVDKIIFTSSLELKKYIGVVNNESKMSCKLYAQVFPVEKKKKIKELQKKVITFGFIGSDSAIQNSLTIKYLIDLWQQPKINHNLIVCGKMEKKYISSKNVKLLGYVEAVSCFYEQIDILICPSYVPGGVKTKVYESFEYGIPVIGNQTTFDSIPLPDTYPFKFDITEIEDLLKTNMNKLISSYLMAKSQIEQFIRNNNRTVQREFIQNLIDD